MDDNFLNRLAIERKENWREICKSVPTLHFKPEWEVRIIPPFSGAMARFTVDYNGKHVSVYLDWYSRLGYVNVPYYELYSFNGAIKRYYLNETEELMKDIEAVLEEKDGYS